MTWDKHAAALGARVRHIKAVGDDGLYARHYAADVQLLLLIIGRVEELPRGHELVEKIFEEVSKL